MTTSRLTLQGDITVGSNAANVSSGAAGLSLPLAANMTFDEYSYQAFDLLVDGVTTIPLGALANVNALMIQAVGASGVVVRITTSLGTTQVIPTGKLLLLLTQDYNITALDVQRTAGQDTTLYVLLGQRA